MNKARSVASKARLALHRLKAEMGQTTAEYALVLIAAATVAVVLITWASGDDNGLKDFFKKVMTNITNKVQ